MRKLSILSLIFCAACGTKSVATVESDAADDVSSADTNGSDGELAADAGGEVTVATDDAPLAHAVNPMIGTSFGGGNVGSSYPAATRPWGLCKVGPDTQNDGGANGTLHCSGYQYMDPYIYGFRHNRLEGTGAPDSGNLAGMPFTSLDASSPSRKLRALRLTGWI